MAKILIRSVIPIFLAALVYLLSAFIANSLNPQTWGMDGRAAAVVVWLFATFAIISFLYINKES